MMMLLLGFIVLGKKFAAGTILSSLIFPFFLAMFEAIPQLQHLTSDMLLSAIYAGLFTGLGCGIVFRVGYSTGGMDIPPIIMNKKLHISLGVCVYLFDRGCTFVNVTTGYFHDQQKAVLCVVNNREYPVINDLVMEIDPTAFIIGSEIHSVKGRGFTLPNIDLDKQIRDHVS